MAAYEPTGTIRSLPPLPRSSTVRSTVSRSSTSSPTASEMRAPVPYSTSSSARSRFASVVPAEPAAVRIASTSASGSALGSRLAGVGGFTPAAGSAAASPSPTANLWNPRTATTVRAAEVELSAGWSASPSRSRTRKSVTTASLTPSRSSMPRAPRYPTYLRRSRRYDRRVLAASPRSTDRWSR